MSIDTGALRIGEFARRVGVSPGLLRAWEHRYGLLQPVRTEGGFRNVFLILAALAAAVMVSAFFFPTRKTLTRAPSAAAAT